MKSGGIHYLQITDDRPQSPLRLKCIERVKAIVRPDVDEYENVSFPWQDDVKDRARMAELIRFEKARTIPNLCYVDTDCFVHEPFLPPEDGKPYFAMYDFNTKEQRIPDIYYFFVNGNTDYFVKHFSKLHHEVQEYSIDVQILRNLIDYGTIPESSYVHCYTTMRSIIDRKQEPLTKVQMADSMELATLRKHIELMVIAMRSYDEHRKE